MHPIFFNTILEILRDSRTKKEGATTPLVKKAEFLLWDIVLSWIQVVTGTGFAPQQPPAIVYVKNHESASF